MMDAWWQALDLAPKIFYVIGIASGGLLLVQTIMTLFGADGDIEGLDVHDGDVSVFSIRTVTAFFVGFGWTGVALLNGGSSVPVATLGGVFVGGLFMVGVLVLMRFVYGLQTSGTVDYANAVGRAATVYVPIAPNLSGTGQVEFVIQSRHRVLDARTRGERRLERGERVRILEITGTTEVLVEPIDSHASDAQVDEAQTNET